jgi:hypothetical protein
MNKKIYDEHKIKILNANPNVVRVKYGKEIEYTSQFKDWAVKEKLTHPDKSSNQIFKESGFDLSILGKRLPNQRIRYWIGSYCRYKKDYYFYPESEKNLELKEKENKHILLIILSRIDHLISVILKDKK